MLFVKKYSSQEEKVITQINLRHEFLFDIILFDEIFRWLTLDPRQIHNFLQFFSNFPRFLQFLIFLSIFLTIFILQTKNLTLFYACLGLQLFKCFSLEMYICFFLRLYIFLLANANFNLHFLCFVFLFLTWCLHVTLYLVHRAAHRGKFGVSVRLVLKSDDCLEGPVS